jgi:hypothetical protein
MSIFIERNSRGVAGLIREVAADRASSAAIQAYEAGESDGIPAADVIVPPVIIQRRMESWRHRRSSKNRREIESFVIDEATEETVASRRDVADRLNYQISRCAALAMEGGLTAAWRRFRRKHFPQVWEIEEVYRNSLANGES